MNFDTWNLGKNGQYALLIEGGCMNCLLLGPLGVAYPPTIDKAELNVQEVLYNYNIPVSNRNVDNNLDHTERGDPARRPAGTLSLTERNMH